MIRDAAESDFEGVLSLIMTMDEYHHQCVPDRIKGAEQARLEPQSFHAQIADKSQILLLALKGGEIVGLARAQLVDQAEGRAHLARRIALIHEIVVQRDLRRSGIGKALFNRVRRWANSNSVSTIELNVYDFNDAALKFYNALGFQCLMRRLTQVSD